MLGPNLLKSDSPRTTDYYGKKEQYLNRQLVAMREIGGKWYLDRIEKIQAVRQVIPAAEEALVAAKIEAKAKGLKKKERAKFLKVPESEKLRLATKLAYHFEAARVKSSGAIWNLAHCHQAAIRVMVKGVRRDFYVPWLESVGLDVRPPYAEEKLALVHGA